MLGKAARTKDLSSYSRGHLVLANVGNLFYSVYVFHMPPGPIWALHTFYLASTAPTRHLSRARSQPCPHPSLSTSRR